MTTTRAILTPFDAALPSTNFPQMLMINNRPVLAFDATTSETAYWTLMIPAGFTSPMTAIITYMMASAVTGGVAFDVAVEAVTDGDATDLDAGTSFDTVNAVNTAAVPGTAGYIDQLTVSLTNGDSAAVADYYRISIARDVADANDTATGDLYLLAVALQDAA
jgi:hypothetical protein